MMALIATAVETVCPRCERTVYYDITYDLGSGWSLVPKGRAETEYGPVWLAYRDHLGELVREAFYILTKNFPEGAPKGEMVNTLVRELDLIPRHAETVLLLIRDEGLAYVKNEEGKEWIRWV